jgi:hypothetical protein
VISARRMTMAGYVLSDLTSPTRRDMMWLTFMRLVVMENSAVRQMTVKQGLNRVLTKSLDSNIK